MSELKTTIQERHYFLRRKKKKPTYLRIICKHYTHPEATFINVILHEYTEVGCFHSPLIYSKSLRKHKNLKKNCITTYTQSLDR